MEAPALFNRSNEHDDGDKAKVHRMSQAKEVQRWLLRAVLRRDQGQANLQRVWQRVTWVWGAL